MSEKRLYSYDKGNNKILCNLNDVCDFNVSNVFQLLNSLANENEQLRKTMNEVIELLVEEVDLFSDKATEHDIIAYKEMNNFDNKDAYYMAISTKKAIKMLKGDVE